MAQSVKGFIEDSYQLVTANNPVVPLQGNDFIKGLQFMNELLTSYSASALLLTVSREVVFNMAIGQQFVTFASPDFIPTPDVASGRLANLGNAWLLLDGVTYPLNNEDRDEFMSAWKYLPQQGLPRYVIVDYNTDYTTMRVYPAPSQVFELHVYGKFQLAQFTANDDMSTLPGYYTRFLRLALAKDLGAYKGRMAAWTDKLEGMLKSAKEDMESVSSVNLDIETDHGSWLNGSWRVKAGI